MKSPKVDSKVEDETRLLIWTKIIKNIFGGRRPGFSRCNTVLGSFCAVLDYKMREE